MIDLSAWNKSIQTYEQWLPCQSQVAANMWSRRLHSKIDSALVEAAAAEAIAWDYLRDRLGYPYLADLPGVGGPDFRFEKAAGSVFVEVTNLTREKVSKDTRLTNLPEGKSSAYSLLTGLIKRKIIKKAGQFGDLGAPIIVVVSTLHFQASALCIKRHHIEKVLPSEQYIACPWDPATGEAIGSPYQETDFDLAAFARDKSPIAARTHLSAVIVAGFGCQPPDAHIFGLHNPEAIHPFDDRLAGDIPFCRFVTWPPKEYIELTWSDEKPSA